MSRIQTLIYPARRPRLEVIALGAAAMAASVLILFGHWEISGETWAYWLWAKIFAENGTFTVPDRSPLYILYLNAFAWLGYPASVTAEHFVSGLIFVAALVVLFRGYMGLWLSFLAALLWLPFLQIAEPPVQKLALAFSLWALHLRVSGAGRGRMAASYGLFGVAAMLRTAFLGFIVLFAAWDLYRALRGGGLRGLVPGSRTLRALAVPVVLLVGLQVWFVSNQSPHPWNNVWNSTTAWYPLSNPKSHSESFFIHIFNIRYIQNEYGTFEDVDWYFTNEELFDGKQSALGAIRSNPSFIIRQLVSNIKPAIFTSVKFTELRYLPLLRVYDSLVLVAILVGAFLATGNTRVRLFVVGSTIIFVASVAVLPRYRHFVPLVPVLILAAHFYGSRLRVALTTHSDAYARLLLWAGLLGVALIAAYIPLRGLFAPQSATRLTYAGVSAVLVALFLIAIGAYRARNPDGRLHSAYGRFLGVSVLVVPLILLSNGATNWIGIVGAMTTDVRQGDFQVLEYRDFRSMKASFRELQPLVEGCAGVLAVEHTFIGAFLDVPLDRLYDVWEIPPFGRLGESEYDGLRPDRIDCVLVSDVFATTIGMGTNVQIRYDNYVEPYVRQLKAMGATTHEIERFGQAVILKKSG